MVQDDKNGQNVTIYEIENRKYTVITKCIDEVENTNKLYDIICKYAITQINSNSHIGNFKY